MAMNKQTKQKLIYARYILPPVLILLILLLTFIPSYRYVAGGDARVPISLSTLISNSWEESRETLFVKSQNDVKPQELVFSKTMLGIILGSGVLYLIARAVAAWSAFVALKLFMSDDEDSAERSRTLFITFIPNRIVLTALEALALPMLAIPYIMPLVYAYTLGTRVGFTLAAPDGFIVLSVALVALCVLSALTAPYERRFDADVFKKREPFGLARAEEAEEEEEEEELSDEELAFKEEQAERIRRLLGKRDGEDK